MPVPPNVSQPEQTPPKKGLLFEIVFVVVFLAILFGILNYFNILNLSEIFPNYLGFLPRKDAPNGTSQQSRPPTLSPTDQTKQTLMSFLPTVIAPSFLPQSPSDITLTEDKDDKERINASWRNKGEGGGTLWAVFPKTPSYQKITLVDVFFEQIQTASPSVQLAKSEVNKIFSSNPKGEWGCSRDPLNQRKLYCENFWEEQGSKKGLGFLILNTSPFRGRLVFSFCQHTKDSNYYSWKSCRSDFAKTGVR